MRVRNAEERSEMRREEKRRGEERRSQEIVRGRGEERQVRASDGENPPPSSHHLPPIGCNLAEELGYSGDLYGPRLGTSQLHYRIKNSKFDNC
jgi:hypothetical protein